MAYTIPLAIIFICLAVIIFIIVRKFSQLAAINTATIAEERAAEVRARIVTARLNRKLGVAWQSILKVARPAGKVLKTGFTNIHQRLVDLEKHYQERGAKLLGASAIEKKIQLLLHEAALLEDKEEFEEAEKRYIEIISLDKKNMKAYEGLGNLYIKTKQYAQAEEIFNFILKHNPSDASVMVSLGELAMGQEKPEVAEAFFEKAVAVRPNNPKYLDFLIETSIMVGNKDLARKTLERLVQVNPENQKIQDFRARIDSLAK